MRVAEAVSRPSDRTFSVRLASDAGCAGPGHYQLGSNLVRGTSATPVTLPPPISLTKLEPEPLTVQLHTSEKSGQHGHVSWGRVPVSSPSWRGAHPPDATDSGPSARSGGSARNGWRRSVQCQDRPWCSTISHRTFVLLMGVSMSAAGIAAPARRPAQSKAALARTVKEQRRGYARAVLAALARSLQGRPTPQIRRIVKTSLQPLGVRLATVELQAIAKGISAGHSVQLPG